VIKETHKHCLELRARRGAFSTEVNSLFSTACFGILKLKLKLILPPTVSRPVCPDVRHPSGTRDQFFFLLQISFRQLRLCYFVAPSPTRGWVCNLLVQFLLGLARTVTLGSKSRRNHGHILLSHPRVPQPGGPGPRIYIPQEQGGPVIPPGHWVPFLSRLMTGRDYGGSILTTLHGFCVLFLGCIENPTFQQR
jgi:hypothetical protein